MAEESDPAQRTQTWIFSFLIKKGEVLKMKGTYSGTGLSSLTSGAFAAGGSLRRRKRKNIRHVNPTKSKKVHLPTLTDIRGFFNIT